MANIVPGVISKVGSTVKHLFGGNHSLFDMSDEKITELIYETHVHADESFDEDSLFMVVESILKRATQTVDKLVQGSNVHLENIQEKTPNAKFNVPLCTLKSIINKLSCKAPGEETAHNTTLEILSQLSTYTWEAKAVVTLAAFALEFGNFWMIAQLYQSDKLAGQLAVLRRVPGLLQPAVLQKHRGALLELTALIKTTMRVIAIFDEFEKLGEYDPKDVPGLSPAVEHMPVDVYWAILAIAACSTKFCILTSDEPDKAHDLAPYSQKIHFTLNKLNLHLTICRRQLVEAETFRRIRKLLRTPTEVMEVFKALIFTKETCHTQTIIDGSTSRTVSIEVLKRKNIFLFVSTLDITDEEISTIKLVYETAKKRTPSYTVVWVPVVDQWSDELRKKFEALRVKMPWYVVQQFSPIAGLRFIKEEWQFKGKATLVVMNPKGQIENLNAFHLIKSWGLKAFPFDRQAEEKIRREINWIGPLATTLHPTIETWIKEEKYIFFYGGKDKDLIQQFTTKAKALANNAVLKESKIVIELFCVGRTSNGGEDHGILSRFWSSIETLFLSKAPKKDDSDDPVTQEIQRLLSFKNESGWAVLSKGSAVIAAGHVTAILKVVEEVDQWKETARENGFEYAFKGYHSQVKKTEIRRCSHLDIPVIAGKVPEAMRCPECPRIMETYISYTCCHNDH